MEQLVFDLVAPEPQAFRTFVAGRNTEAVAALERAATGALPETGIVVWGTPGVGKSHLLAAVADAARRAGRTVLACASPADLTSTAPDAGALLTVDDIDTADAAAQARLFTLYNALRESGGTLVVAASAPPARVPVRDDVRTRLAWGLVYEILPLADDEKPAALAAYARSRGFSLSDDVIVYLLAHGRRDMRTLVATLAALDRRSLARKRPVTVPLLREWLQRSIDDPAQP
ncbi:DnaA regulatory inactivator Hda [Burkholderiales bacterium]|nr:DnaA regulatory inactivator Hda [Burkholderiales bacterium]